MFEQLTNKELAERMGISQGNVRRFVKEVLPPDPVATQQSGIARKHSPNDAFAVFLVSKLISDLGYTMVEAKNILVDIGKWLTDKGLFPVKPDDFVPGSDLFDQDRISGKSSSFPTGPLDPENVTNVYSVPKTVIHIMRANTDTGFFYKAYLTISERKIKKMGRVIIEKQEIEDDTIKERPKPKLLADEINIRLLNISQLLGEFEWKVLRQSPY